MDDKDAAEDRRGRPGADKDGAGDIRPILWIATVLPVIGNPVTAGAVR